MKVTDLMVGDWVMCNHYQDKPFAKQFGVADFAKGEYEFCEPIPLTEDILVKNGFKKQEDVNEWSYYKSKDGKGQYMILWSMDYNYLEIGSYTGEFGEFNRMGIMRYVHQLQHALRLCGIEKELVID